MAAAMALGLASVLCGHVLAVFASATLGGLVRATATGLRMIPSLRCRRRTPKPRPALPASSSRSHSFQSTRSSNSSSVQGTLAANQHTSSDDAFVVEVRPAGCPAQPCGGTHSRWPGARPVRRSVRPGSDARRDLIARGAVASAQPQRQVGAGLCRRGSTSSAPKARQGEAALLRTALHHSSRVAGGLAVIATAGSSI
jgi:hypothetical protein